MKVTVSVEFKPGVLDPEAEAIAKSLHTLGYDNVNAVRRVRQFELDITAADAQSAKLAAEEMCDKLLANPVIESYSVALP